MFIHFFLYFLQPLDVSPLAVSYIYVMILVDLKLSLFPVAI